MFRHRRRSGLHAGASDSFKTDAPGLPTHRMREGPLGNGKWSDVAGNVEWLNAILRISHGGSVTPAAEFDVHFAIVLVATPVVEGVHAQDCGGFQMGGVANYKNVGTVTETASHFEFRAGPLVPFFRDTEMKGAAGVRPGIVAIVQIIQAA